eukprot:1138365-Pelagomonas_calceolata.AAC.7
MQGPQANSQSQQRKQGVVLGSEKKKPGRKKRSRSFNTDDEQRVGRAYKGYMHTYEGLASFIH